MIIKDKAFPNEPKKAIANAIAQADKYLLSKAYDKKSQVLKDSSGSSLNIALVVDDQCFVANVGNSRCILSCGQGQSVFQLT